MDKSIIGLVLVNESLKGCLFCRTVLIGKPRKNKFCGHPCAASFNNRDRLVSQTARLKTAQALKGRLKKVSSKLNWRKCLTCQQSFVAHPQRPLRKYCSKECRSVFQSNLALNNSALGKSNNSRRSLYHSPFAGDVYLDSTWERQVAQHLDGLKIDWERPHEGFKWQDAIGKEHRYYPDFYLLDYDLYLDPKNPWRIKEDAYKIDSVRAIHNIKLLILTKDHLDLSEFCKLLESSRGDSNP